MINMWTVAENAMVIDWRPIFVRASATHPCTLYKLAELKQTELLVSACFQLLCCIPRLQAEPAGKLFKIIFFLINAKI